jgi:hypothetical protein
MKTCGEWRYGCTFLDLGTRWRWVVSFTSRPLYRGEICPRYPLDRRLGGPHSRYGSYGEEKKSCPYRETNSCLPARSSSLYRLSYSDIKYCNYTICGYHGNEMSRVNRMALCSMSWRSKQYFVSAHRVYSVSTYIFMWKYDPKETNYGCLFVFVIHGKWP